MFFHFNPFSTLFSIPQSYSNHANSIFFNFFHLGLTSPEIFCYTMFYGAINHQKQKNNRIRLKIDSSCSLSALGQRQNTYLKGIMYKIPDFTLDSSEMFSVKGHGNEYQLVRFPALMIRISDDWLKVYNYSLYMLETFVEQERFKGTCYKASNWKCVRATKGTSKKGHKHLKHGKIKDVYLYPLKKQFKKILTDEEIS